MDQIKIGKFIAECRKKNNLTQMQLAEKLNITDRAISKWENGKGMPDSSIMLDLCKELKISVNELLSGEMIDMKNYDENAEKNLLEMLKQKEENDKRLLHAEILIGILGLLPFFISLIIIAAVEMEEWLAAVITLTSIIPFLIATPFMLKIEQIAGYYECKECGEKYVPTYKSVFWSRHIGRTRHMKCPKCNKRTWAKKVMSK
ncbi:MAG: helix-turn-helix transcriptional regulator [Clostridiales bacterium]|nr:helix-turn-helix transcriptional regulator [Clostridiales bacterium]